MVEVESADYSASCCIANCESPISFERVDRNPCDVNITVTAEMTGKVYFYYKLTNYFQNHRRYVKSRDDVQLNGRNTTEKALLSSCGDGHHVLANSSVTDDPSNLISPCGLVAWSAFNDSFAMRNARTGAAVAVEQTGIAWASDLLHKYANSPQGTTFYI